MTTNTEDLTADLQRWRRPKSSAWAKLSEAARLLKLLFTPNRSDSNAIYDVLSAHNNLGKRTFYLNMGYWRGAKTYDDACEDLALLLAERAQLCPGLRVLDSGFGFADQDMLWAQRFGVLIVGFNISASQVAVARERVQVAGLADRIDLRCRSVLTTGLPAQSVDRVLALESAFHLNSREDLFREARRVLRPGGIIALADICNTTPPSRHPYDVFSAYTARHSWQIPESNNYGVDEYIKRLAAAGFEDVQVEYLSPYVYKPFSAYARLRQGDPDIVSRANPLMRATWRSPLSERVFDYVLITARCMEGPA